MINSSQTIFSTGVFLKPEKVIINKKEQWRWIAVGFEDDSFLNGNYINPYEYSDTFEGLINTDETGN